MNKKKTIVILLATLLVIVVVLIIILPKNKKEIFTNNTISTYEPEFMNDDEKTSFGLIEDSKIQVLKRGDGGAVEVYKIIREESDIVYDIEAANKLIDPRY